MEEVKSVPGPPEVELRSSRLPVVFASTLKLNVPLPVPVEDVIWTQLFPSPSPVHAPAGGVTFTVPAYGVEIERGLSAPNSCANLQVKYAIKAHAHAIPKAPIRLSGSHRVAIIWAA